MIHIIKILYRFLFVDSDLFNSDKRLDKIHSDERYNFTMPCPYALQEELPESNLGTDRRPKFDSDNSSAKNDSYQAITPAQALQLAKQSCPAFASSCPFRSVSSPEDMKNTLKNMPLSHMNMHNFSHQADISNEGTKTASLTAQSLLQHVHEISRNFRSGSLTSNEDDLSITSRYSIPGGCPFKKLYKNSKQGTFTSFVNAMEEFSLSALMAAMIEQEENQVEGTYVHVSRVPNSNDIDSLDKKESPTVLDLESNGNNTSMKRSSSKTSLSNALKQGTQESHMAAESVHFVKEFIRGNIDRTLYSKLILNLFHVYKNLEHHLEQHASECFPTLHFPKELNRTDALRDDVDFYHGSNEEVLLIPPSKATLDYIHRIEFVANTEPLLLLSHAYTRYLGDLSGGKILARVAKRALNLQDTCSGLAFYNFDEIPSAKLFKDSYRVALDELDLSEDKIERLVAEANVAFVLNMRVFEELDVLNGMMKDDDVRSYESAISYYNVCIERQKAQEKRGTLTLSETDRVDGERETFKCPFAVLGGPNPHEKTKDSTPIPDVILPPSRSTVSNSKGDQKHARCPWPFIFFHDPATGMRDYQTWIVVALFSCFVLRYSVNRDY